MSRRRRHAQPSRAAWGTFGAWRRGQPRTTPGLLRHLPPDGSPGRTPLGCTSADAIPPMACKWSDDSLTTRGSTSRLVCDNTGARLITHRQPGPSPVDVAASPPAVCLGPELAFQLHQAPDPGAVSAAYGSTSAASSRTVARSTPSSSAHRSSGAVIGRPNPGRARSPPNQVMEHVFGEGSATLLGPTGHLELGWAALAANSRTRLSSSRSYSGEVA
jgi:hypothetical protein